MGAVTEWENNELYKVTCDSATASKEHHGCYKKKVKRREKWQKSYIKNRKFKKDYKPRDPDRFQRDIFLFGENSFFLSFALARNQKEP